MFKEQVAKKVRLERSLSRSDFDYAARINCTRLTLVFRFLFSFFEIVACIFSTLIMLTAIIDTVNFITLFRLLTFTQIVVRALLNML